MKKKLIFALAFCSFLGINKVQAQPADPNFNDDKFYECIVSNYDSENGTTFTKNDNLTEQGADYNTIEHLTCKDAEITDLTGIEKFPSLRTLDLTNNNIENIDLSKNVILEEVYLDNNNIKELDLSNNTQIDTVQAENNKIEKIILPDSVENLKISNNPLLNDIKFSSIGENLTISDYIRIPNEFKITYIIEDNGIAMYDETAGKISAKKEGTTLAQLTIKNGNNIAFAPSNSKITVTNECPYQATGARRYIVILETNGGNEIENISKSITFGKELSEEKLEIPTPTKEGYKFIGWYKDAELNNKIDVKTYEDIKDLENTNEKVCSNDYIVKLYAKWDKEVDNPKTGIKTSLILDSGIIIISGIAYLIIRKKNKYNKI